MADARIKHGDTLLPEKTRSLLAAVRVARVALGRPRVLRPPDSGWPNRFSRHVLSSRFHRSGNTHSWTASRVTVPQKTSKYSEIDARHCLESFMAKHGHKLHAIASKGTFLDDGDINRFLTFATGPGRIMAFLEISEWVRGKRYDSVLVDTAPSGHTLRLLEMPQIDREMVETPELPTGQAPLFEAGLQPVRGRR